MDDKTLIKHLDSYMGKHNLRLGDVAKDLGVDKATISRWRGGSAISQINRRGIKTYIHEEAGHQDMYPDISNIVQILKTWEPVWRSRALTAILELEEQRNAQKKQGPGGCHPGELQNSRTA